MLTGLLDKGSRPNAKLVQRYQLFQSYNGGVGTWYTMTPTVITRGGGLVPGTLDPQISNIIGEHPKKFLGALRAPKLVPGTVGNEILSTF